MGEKWTISSKNILKSVFEKIRIDLKWSFADVRNLLQNSMPRHPNILCFDSSTLNQTLSPLTNFCFTGNSSVQWIWVSGGFDAELLEFNSSTSEEGLH